MELTPLDTCEGTTFLIEVTDGGVRIVADGGAINSERNPCWADRRLEGQLGLNLGYSPPQVDRSQDRLDKVFSLITGSSLKFQRRYIGDKSARALLTPRGFRRHLLGRVRAYAVDFQHEENSASMGGVGESWRESGAGEVLVLDRTGLIVEAHLRGKVLYEQTGRYRPYRYRTTTETKPIRLDLVLRCEPEDSASFPAALPAPATPRPQ